jgi:hypothetical protein
MDDGAWAELRSPRKVSERKRKRFVGAMADFQKAVASLPRDADGEPDKQMYGSGEQELLDHSMAMLILALVDVWSLEVPVSVETLDDLSVDDYDALLRACLPLQGELLPDLGVSPDPKAGGERSSDSPISSPTAAG